MGLANLVYYGKMVPLSDRVNKVQADKYVCLVACVTPSFLLLGVFAVAGMVLDVAVTVAVLLTFAVVAAALGVLSLLTILFTTAAVEALADAMRLCTDFLDKYWNWGASGGDDVLPVLPGPTTAPQPQPLPQPHARSAAADGATRASIEDADLRRALQASLAASESERLMAPAQRTRPAQPVQLPPLAQLAPPARPASEDADLRRALEASLAVSAGNAAVRQPGEPPQWQQAQAQELAAYQRTQPARSESKGQQRRTYTVALPPGAVPGQRLAVSAPDGKQYHIHVPQPLPASGTMTVAY